MATFTRAEIVDTIRFSIAGITSRFSPADIITDSVLKKVDIDDAGKLMRLKLRMHDSFKASHRGSLSTNEFLDNLDLDVNDTVRAAANKTEIALGFSFTPKD